jgi:hypothetical protein
MVGITVLFCFSDRASTNSFVTSVNFCESRQRNRLIALSPTPGGFRLRDADHLCPSLLVAPTRLAIARKGGGGSLDEGGWPIPKGHFLRKANPIQNRN